MAHEVMRTYGDSFVGLCKCPASKVPRYRGLKNTVGTRRVPHLAAAQRALDASTCGRSLQDQRRDKIKDWKALRISYG
jgi:hypothetical protein